MPPSGKNIDLQQKLEIQKQKMPDKFNAATTDTNAPPKKDGTQTDTKPIDGKDVVKQGLKIPEGAGISRVFVSTAGVAEASGQRTDVMGQGTSMGGSATSVSTRPLPRTELML